MTRMLVRVTDAGDAAAAAAAGVDAVEFLVSGATGADMTDVRAIRTMFAGTLRLSVEGLSLPTDLVAAAKSAGVDEVAVALDVAPSPVPVVDARLPPGLVAVARLAAAPDSLDAIQRVRGRVDAVMLEAGRVARLFDKVGIAQLDAFASSCRASGLPFGFSGGLEAPDVARLLLLHPDVLGFDRAVRVDHRADGPLDPTALDAIRALIPREGVPAVAAKGPERGAVLDRIFVRDFVLPLSIGAYQAEHGMRQRVRFTIEADVRRAPLPPRDMRDVFSYDVIIETVRVLSQRAHVTFVETLAEEIAAALFVRAEIEAVRVKVEKLDVIDGSVGIEVHRGRGSRG